MTTLYHEIVVQAEPDRIWSLLTTRTGLEQWWPGSISTHGADSWQFQAQQQEVSMVFRVVEEETESVLEWLCTQGEDYWHNTLVHWRIEKAEGENRLILEHRDLRETPSELASLNTRWGVLMNRIALQLQEERRKG
ncbi:SRPBCC domain-containing protein [Reinekea marinisedimentorum]|uniref:Activator of Hsp90 ATPase-like protein n=1 Tax=Reinekea marinisedimentorum TaxID=230495 RepID=A0A4R3IE81_9GAMM|nr:SRPBCC domain-containing protein [Reinekea marinisedimentorum]TCS44067.1 activator of Hsp90 ATPase-like protein [Reinekea marinisedimentorum]